MPNQFGTKRLTSSPLQDYLKLQEINKNKELARAQKTTKDNPFSDIYEKEGKFYETVADGGGGLIDQEITPAQYQMKRASNEAGNASRRTLGLNPIEATPRKEEPPKEGIVKKATNYLKDKVSAFATKRAEMKTKPVQVQEAGDAGRDTLQPSNSNITGSSIDVAKSGTTGGAVKTDLTKEPKPIIADPETEKAYQKSLKPMQGNKPKVFAGTPETEKAYQQSLTHKGKAPPNLSKREKANIADGSYRKKAEALDARRNQLQQNIDAQKAKSGQSPNIFSQISQEKTRRAGKAVPRLSMPSKEAETQQAIAQLEKHNKDKSFVASAKSSNQKAQQALAKYEKEQRHNNLVNSPTYLAQQNKSMASANYKKPDANTVSDPTIGSFANRSPVKKSEIQYAGRSKKSDKPSLVERRAIQKKRYPSRAEGSSITRDILGRTGKLTGDAKKDKAILAKNKEKRKMALKQIGTMFKRGGSPNKFVNLDSINKSYKKSKKK